MNAVTELLKRKTIFHCKRRGHAEGTRDFEVVHTLADPAPHYYIPEWATPSLKPIYERWNGFKLFQPSHDVDEGFKFFSLFEIVDQLDMLEETFTDNLDAYKEGTKFDDLEEWLNGLIPIAEIMCSGDKYVLDTFHKNENGECPILFLDHEYYYGGSCDPEITARIAENAVELIEDVINNPLQHIASHWLGGNRKQQWYPESITIV